MPRVNRHKLRDAKDAPRVVYRADADSDAALPRGNAQGFSARLVFLDDGMAARQRNESGLV